MGTNVIPLKKNDDVAGLISNEDAIVRKAMSLGHKDPRVDEKCHAKLLLVPIGDKIYRRFITGMIELSQDDISEAQIRLKVSDEKYCREELGPLIEKNGLEYLPFVSRGTQNIWNMETGHHRSFYLLHQRRDESFFAFVVSNEFYEALKDGTYGKPVSNSYAKVKGRIQCNPPPAGNFYKLTDIFIQLAGLRKADPTFGGLVPSGEFPTREEFDDIMNDIHPKQFLYKATRTKIRNQWIRSGTDANSKVKPVTFADKTNDLVKNGYDPGVTMGRKNKQKRKKFLEHFDEDKKTYLAFTSTNGNNFRANIITSLIESHHDGTLVGDSSYEIVVYCDIYNVKESLTLLEQDRNSFVEEVKKWNDILKNTCRLKFGFSKIIFPKQLTIPSDTGKVIKL